MRLFLKILTLLAAAVFACKNNPEKPAATTEQAAPPPSSEPTLTLITKEGKAILSDGRTVEIPHFNDRKWMVFYIVRHCEKVKGDSPNPELSEEGKERAKRLGQIMDSIRIDRIGTTNLKRTMQTGDAVARETGDPARDNFPPTMVDIWLEDVMAGGGGKHIFHVGHSNTVPALLNRFTGKQTYTDIPDDEYGRFFIVLTQGVGKSEVLEFRY